mgnify:CR=1 FL=1
MDGNEEKAGGVTVIGSVVLVLVVILGGWYLLSAKPAKAPTTGAPSPSATATATTTEQTAPTPITVAYTDQGFSPASVTVHVGTTVTFVNQSSKKMWVASAMHPAHTVYSGTSLSQHCPDTANTAFDECVAVSSGGSYSFTFNKVGDWKYHNHVGSSDFGSVVVTP